MSGVLHGVLASLKTAAAAVTDAFFEYVTLLLNTITTNGAQNNTFLDGSTNAFSITRNGNTTQGTFSPFSQTGWSNYFDGTGDYLTVADNANLRLGASDFCVELWFFPQTNTPSIIVTKRANSSTFGAFVIDCGASLVPKFYASANGTSFAISGPTIGTLVAGQWNHIAVYRSGTNWYGAVNGTVATLATSTSLTLIGTTDPWVIGGDTNGFQSTGYISNTRIVIGSPVYGASNFTPPTASLTAITNTSLLTCQSNRFIDNSSNAFAITRNGDVSVQAFSPFNPTAAWSASTNGGSGYFDGTGDWLNPGTNAAFAFGTGDFTVEAFVCVGSSGAGPFDIYDSRVGTTGSINGFSIYVISNSIRIDTSVAGVMSGGVVPTNVWTHIAVTRAAGTWRLFVDGVQVSTTTASYNLTDGYASIGAYNGTLFFNGYLSNVRLVKGTALYTTAFTPPTTPLTNITNTSLLLNFTNAGIFDSASGNDLETVGNAQVSTAVAKWGTTSMAFDGTGDWLVDPDGPTQRLGTGDFTIEGWVYLNAAGVAYGIVSKGTSTTGWSVNVTSGNKLQFSYTATQLTGATSLAATTWYHFAVVRSGSASGNLKVYLNGTADATSAGAVTDNFNQTNVTYVGADRVAGSALNGYIDDLRITNGYARYTANFTPPTAAFPVQ